MYRLSYGNQSVASVCNQVKRSARPQTELMCIQITLTPTHITRIPQVAADGACHGLRACAGRCVEAMAPPRDRQGLFDKFNPTVLIVVAAIGVAALLLCCCCRRGSHVLRQHEARTMGVVAPAPRSPSRRDWEQDCHPPVPALLDQPVPLPRRVPSSKPIRKPDGTVTMLSPTGSGRHAVSPVDRGVVVRTPPPSAPPPSDERDRYRY